MFPPVLFIMCGIVGMISDSRLKCADVFALHHQYPGVIPLDRGSSVLHVCRDSVGHRVSLLDIVLVLLKSFAEITGFTYVYCWAVRASDPVNDTGKFALRKLVFNINQLTAQLACWCVLCCVFTFCLGCCFHLGACCGYQLLVINRAICC